MKQFGKMMLLAFGFGLLAVVLFSIPNHPAAASGSAPVTVVGGVTGATPVPVSLQGTGNISGNVNAAQSGAWNVGINNFPNTQNVSATQSGTWSVGISNTPNVTVANAPLIVRSTDEPVRQFFTIEGNIGANDSFLSPANPYVVEFISASCTATRGNQMFDLRFLLQANGTTRQTNFPVVTTSSSNGTTTYVLAQQTRIYGDGGGFLQFTPDGTDINSTSPSCGNVTVFGYTVTP